MKARLLGSLTTGRTIELGGRWITPVARALVLPFPGNKGGLVYNRPEAVIVRAEGGAEQRLAVPDLTRRYQLLVLAVAAGLLFIFRLLTLKIVQGT